MSENISESRLKKPVFCLGTSILGMMFVYWNCTASDTPWLTRAAAFVIVILSGIIFYHFVPSWLDFWSVNSPKITDKDDTAIQKELMIKLFFLFLAADVFYLVLIAAMQFIAGQTVSFNIWLHLDSDHYINIAKDGYLPLTQDNWNRAVELVFLPGYPYVLRVLNVVIRNFLLSGLIVSALFFASSGCMFYRLLRLDYEHARAMRAVKFLLLCPGMFFFVAPMSESMFFFFCLMSMYAVRKGKSITACIAAAAAGFTRSLGITLLVPVFLELVHRAVSDRQAAFKQKILMILPVLIVPLGFGAYCAINYKISGNPFQFLEYQAVHWYQKTGFFFASGAYQFQRLLEVIGLRHPNVLGRWLPNCFSCFSALILISLTAKKLRPSYTAWFIAYYFIAIGATALMSAPRYLMVCFPLFISIMLLTENKYADRFFAVLSAPAALVYAYAWVMDWNVW